MQTKYKLYYSGKRYDYYAVSDGYILRVAKKSYTEHKVKGFVHNGVFIAKIAGKEVKVKKVIAQMFIPGYRKGMSVINIDGNIRNCNVENLRLISKCELGKQTGHLSSRSRPVIVTAPDGSNQHYRSVRKAAEALFVSSQTALDYMKRPSNRSVLRGYMIKEA